MCVCVHMLARACVGAYVFVLYLGSGVNISRAVMMGINDLSLEGLHVYKHML